MLWNIYTPAIRPSLLTSIASDKSLIVGTGTTFVVLVRITIFFFSLSCHNDRICRLGFPCISINFSSSQFCPKWRNQEVGWSVVPGRLVWVFPLQHFLEITKDGTKGASEQYFCWHERFVDEKRQSRVSRRFATTVTERRPTSSQMASNGQKTEIASSPVSRKLKYEAAAGTGSPTLGGWKVEKYVV